jgi:glycosyltransferase involved in cell wall biosynthesis
MASRPRILIVPSWYPTSANPVVGSFFREEALVLDERYDVRVLLGFPREVGRKSALLDHRWWPRPGRALVRRLPAGTIVEPPAGVAFEYFHRSFNEPDKLAASIDAYQRVIQELREAGWAPDVLHAYSSVGGGVVAAALAKRLGLPWVLVENDMFVLDRYTKFWAARMKEAIREASALVAVSHHQLRCILMHDAVPQGACHVVGNLVDETVFPLAPPRRDPARFRVLTVTYPFFIKDCETFFRGLAAMVRRGHTDVEATVIGNDSFKDLSRANTTVFEQLARTHGVEQYCRFVAHVPRREMPERYAECDVFVSTSIAETFGVSIREAMAVGRPVVCTGSGGVDDTLAPVNGLKVNIRDAEGLAEALIAVKTGQATFVPEEIRLSMVRKHGRAAFLARMSAVYDGVLAGRAAAPTAR